LIDYDESTFPMIRAAFETPQPEFAPEVGDPDECRVLVLHGIRASNNVWPTQLAEYIQETWPNTTAFPATYGRFSARRFMLPSTRRKFLPWMHDMYADLLAANPKATFHFIGHSKRHLPARQEPGAHSRDAIQTNSFGGQCFTTHVPVARPLQQ